MNRSEIEKPRQSLGALWNISFGFLGIQVGFALQTANMSRIFQSLGSSLDDLPALWIAAPLTGLLVQPIIGHLSDRTWLGKLGRRRPYFVAGSILAALSLFLMPLSSSLFMAAILPGKHELVFLENHDMGRIASDPGMTPEKLRTAATLMTMLKGIPSIYYGQELGMRGTPRDEYKSDEREIGMREAFRWSAKVEAPGQAVWYKGPKSYWTKRFASDHDGISLPEENSDPSSLLNHYRKLLRLRAAHPALRSGDQRIVPTTGNLLVVERSGQSERLLVAANLSDRAADYPVTGLDLLSGRRVSAALHLRPYSASIIRR
jgi:hypothetical protein